MDMFDVIFFRTGVIALVMVSMVDKPKRQMPEYINKVVFGLLGLVIANIFIHTFSPVVLHNTLNLFLAIIGFYVVYQHYDEAKSLGKFILLAAGLNLVFFISQRMGFDPIWNKLPYKGEEGAFLGNKPRLMTYFALVTPFLHRDLLWLSIILGLWTKQYIIFIPVIVALFMGMKSLQAKRAVLLCAVIFLAIISKRIIQSLVFRFNMSYKPVLTAFFTQPLIGFGLGVRPIPELEVMGNSYLQFIVGVGLAGLVWFGYIFKAIWQKIGLRNLTPAFITLALIMLVEYPIELPRLWFLIMAIIMMQLLKGGKDVSSN
jgi:hypothetical protein